jgi:hypothetical protein
MSDLVSDHEMQPNPAPEPTLVTPAVVAVRKYRFGFLVGESHRRRVPQARDFGR